MLRICPSQPANAGVRPNKKMNTNKFFLLCIIAFTVVFSQNEIRPSISDTIFSNENDLTPASAIQKLFNDQSNNVIVTVSGKIIKILNDDLKGSRHQKFIIQLSNGHTLLIAHNIDIAQRVTGIKIGTKVIIHGEYEWNNKGGVIHWTHRDINGFHENGWIKVGEEKYD